MKMIISAAVAAAFIVMTPHAVFAQEAAATATATANTSAAAALSAVALASVEAASARTQEDVATANMRRIDFDIAARATALDAKIEAPRR